MSGRDSLTSSTPLSSTPGSPRLPQGLSRRQKKNRKRDKEEQRAGGCGKKSSASPALSRNNSEDKCGGGGAGGAGEAAPLSRSKKRSTACKQVGGSSGRHTHTADCDADSAPIQPVHLQYLRFTCHMSPLCINTL